MNERHFDEKSVIGIEVISKIKRQIKIVLKRITLSDVFASYGDTSQIHNDQRLTIC